MTHFLADGLAIVDHVLASWSPDAMPLDFFQWGCVKYYVYISSMDVIGTLCAKIIEASRVLEELLTHTWELQDYHVDVISATSF